MSITRYRYEYDKQSGSRVLYEHTEGEYVKWDDIRELLKSARAVSAAVREADEVGRPFSWHHDALYQLTEEVSGL